MNNCYIVDIDYFDEFLILNISNKINLNLNLPNNN